MGPSGSDAGTRESSLHVSFPPPSHIDFIEERHIKRAGSHNSSPMARVLAVGPTRSRTIHSQPDPTPGAPPALAMTPRSAYRSDSARTGRHHAVIGTGQVRLSIPRASMAPSSARSSLSFSARVRLISRVSQPCTVLACAQRSRPCWVLAPVDAPPCVRHTRLPRIAGLRH